MSNDRNANYKHTVKITALTYFNLDANQISKFTKSQLIFVGKKIIVLHMSCCMKWQYLYWSLAIIRETNAFIRKSYALYRESFAFIREINAFIRESFAFIHKTNVFIREIFFYLWKWAQWAFLEITY